MSSLVHTQPWWYWAIYAVFVVAVVLAVWFARWHIATEATKLVRRIDVVNGDGIEDRIARMCWTHMRDVEATLAWLIAAERAVREHPDRVAALLSEDVPFNDAIAAVAS